MPTKKNTVTQKTVRTRTVEELESLEQTASEAAERVQNAMTLHSELVGKKNEYREREVPLVLRKAVNAAERRMLLAAQEFVDAEDQLDEASTSVDRS